MKNDIRIAYPLWQMWFLLLITAAVYFVGTSGVMEIGVDNSFTFSISSTSSNVVSLFIFSLVLPVSLLIYGICVVRHNVKNPDRKIPTFYIKPPEFIEDDELFLHATGQATRKVYTFFATALPLLVLLFIFLPIGKMWIIILLLLLAFMQYFIYYLEIRKYVVGVE